MANFQCSNNHLFFCAEYRMIVGKGFCYKNGKQVTCPTCGNNTISTIDPPKEKIGFPNIGTFTARSLSERQAFLEKRSSLHSKKLKQQYLAREKEEGI